MRRLLSEIEDLFNDYLLNRIGPVTPSSKNQNDYVTGGYEFREPEHEELSFYAQMKSRVLVDLLPKLLATFHDCDLKSCMREDFDTQSIVITVTLKEKP